MTLARSQPRLTGRRNKLDEQAALHQAAVDEKDSEIASMRELVNVGTEDLTTLQATTDQIREERERLQLRYNELGLSLEPMQWQQRTWPDR